MTEDEVIHIVTQAFAQVRRPDVLVVHTDWTESSGLADTLALRDNETLTANDLKGSTSFLTSEAFRYFMPALVRLAFWNDCEIEDLNSDLVDKFCMPFPRDKLPDHHPKTPNFTREQTLAVLVFLEHVKATSNAESDPHPEVTARILDRGIRNWKYFASRC